MTQQDDTYETPTYSPSGAFARTLRGAEVARRAREGRRYETPVFDPRGAFARTLRGGEMARRGRLGVAVAV